MRNRSKLRGAALTTLGAMALTLSTLAAPVSPVAAVGFAGEAIECLDGDAHGGAAARGGRDVDHRGVSASEQRAIEKRTRDRLARKGGAEAAAAASATVPVYVHVMRAKDGSGDVTDQQIAAQIDVLNASFAGQGGDDAADTGFDFALAGTFRYNNNQWHKDRQSKKYRSQTRQGGASALNIWLVDFNYLGIATFPWDYSRQGSVDGIRVHWDSLPGGSITNYNLGETATHEAGHWFGLYHTFQGGCTSTNDEVADTPAQDGPSSGCPVGADTCPLPGDDPIHNYMDYSYDSCYTQFTTGQSTRASQMWTAYRG